MTIVSLIRLVLNMRRVDSDTARLLLRGLVNLRVVRELGASGFGEDLRDSSGEGGFPVINMPDGPNVHVGFRTGKLRRGLRVAATQH